MFSHVSSAFQVVLQNGFLEVRPQNCVNGRTCQKLRFLTVYLPYAISEAVAAFARFSTIVLHGKAELITKP